ncbi:MAG: lipopolysaccharide heptosyltransferase II, partial [Candidatus Adiutrix sp.]
MKNILVRSTNWIGDAVMMMPAFFALRQNFPQSQFTVMAAPWVAPLYEAQSHLPQIILFDKKGAHKSLKARYDLIKRLHSEKFDLAFLFQNAFEAALMAALAQIPHRWGYGRDGRSFLLTKAPPVPPTARFNHEVFYYLNLLEQVGLKSPFISPSLLAPHHAQEEISKILGPVNNDEFTLAIAPGAAFGQAKQWAPHNFAQASSLILDKRPGRVLILGAASEAKAANKVFTALAAIYPPHKILNLAGTSNLAGAMALLSRSSMLLTNDSGLMHLAGALKVPLVAAFGPTNPLTTGPLGLSRVVRAPVPCAPCYKRECPLSQCICFQGVTPEKVADAALNLLNSPAPTPSLSQAVFLDRDGTINHEVNFLSRPLD